MSSTIGSCLTINN